MIRALKLGIPQSMLMYAKYCFPLSSFVLQFIRPSTNLMAIEDRGIQILTASPRHSIPTKFLGAARLYNIGFSVPLIAVAADAIAYRAAVRSVEYYRTANRSTMADDHINCLLTHPFPAWKVGKAHAVMEAAVLRATPFAAELDHEDPHLQRKLAKILLQHRCGKAAIEVTRARLCYWGPGFTTEVAEKLMANIEYLNKKTHDLLRRGGSPRHF